MAAKKPATESMLKYKQSLLAVTAYMLFVEVKDTLQEEENVVCFLANRLD